MNRGQHPQPEPRFPDPARLGGDARHDPMRIAQADDQPGAGERIAWGGEREEGAVPDGPVCALDEVLTAQCDTEKCIYRNHMNREQFLLDLR